MTSPKTRLWSQAESLMDGLSVAKIDWLTRTFGRFLPDGYWGGAPAGDKTLYLTFDDGPDPHLTPYLLEFLESEDIPATFFLIGRHAARHPQLVEDIHKAGHLIGNHSYHHLFLPGLSVSQLEHEIQSTNDRVKEITGKSPKFFRPPFGLMDKRAGDCLAARGMKSVYWTCAPEDWLHPGADSVVRRVMTRVKNGAVIVLHEGSGLHKQTLPAVRKIIAACKQQGYSFSAIPAN